MIKEHEIPLPRWELTDPFGRAALRSMRYELKKALCERDGYREERDEILKAKANAVDGLMDTLKREQDRSSEFRQMYYKSEEVRKLVAQNNRELREDLKCSELARAQLRIELERLREEHAQLQEDHEKLLRSVTDKEAEI